MTDIEIDPVEALIGAAWFPVICPRCECQHQMALDPMLHAALSNEVGESAVEARFDALETNPPEVPCGYCIFRYGAGQCPTT